MKRVPVSLELRSTGRPDIRLAEAEWRSAFVTKQTQVTIGEGPRDHVKNRDFLPVELERKAGIEGRGGDLSERPLQGYLGDDMG